MSWTLLRMTWRARAALLELRDDRGDVPGWVLITVMTAGLVSGLWVLAGPRARIRLQQRDGQCHRTLTGRIGIRAALLSSSSSSRRCC